MMRLVLTLILFFAASTISAQATEARERDRMLIAYKVAPADRVAFRAYLTREGKAAFQKAREDGTISEYRLFISLYANDDLAFDAAALIEFERAEDMASWQKVERRATAGLAGRGIALTRSVNTEILDEVFSLDSDDQEKSDNSGSVLYIIAPHAVETAKLADYRRFSQEYLKPVIESYIQRNVLESFKLYMNAYPAGSKWQALLVFGYADLTQVEAKENVQSIIRRELAAGSADWKEWYNRRYDLRNELHSIIAEVIYPEK